MGGSTSCSCMAIVTHKYIFLKIIFLAVDFSVAKVWKLVANYFSDKNGDWIETKNSVSSVKIGL